MTRTPRKHWTTRYKDENVQLKEEIARLKRQPMLKDFGLELGKAMSTMLAFTPYDKWPEFAKTAFYHVSDGRQTVAYLYKEQLPKGDSDV